MSKKGLNEIIKKIEKAGHKVDRIERGKHYKLFLTTTSGKKILTVSVSTSDNGHAAKNNDSLLKRWAA
jgi:hypothetical protein